ncbi:MAG TPA: S1 RNA-binding domain-containing protein, partial [Smithellaceae bacterium]|nr:S1 RNA-binding domain-containing protein [Smithellaceae bacterium]
MKYTMLINAVHREQKRMVTVDEKGKLIEFNIEMSMKDPITGNIYKGKVLKVERGLQAAFVDYGGGKDGFLPLRDISPEYLTEPENGQGGGRPVLKAGQEIIVQAVREVTGNKGALLTSYISLPGRYVVLLPNKPGGGISRKINTEE